MVACEVWMELDSHGGKLQVETRGHGEWNCTCNTTNYIITRGGTVMKEWGYWKFGRRLCSRRNKKRKSKITLHIN